jgi:predicted nuclease of predicted toxin-antitoxin system
VLAVGSGRAPNLNDPFLIDECLSPDLVAAAHTRGHFATHVVFRNLQGSEDPDLMPVITAEGFVFVTNNGRDFLNLYENLAIHPGLVIIVPNGLKARQQVKVFNDVLDVIEPRADLINKLVIVDAAGRIEIVDWPHPRDNKSGSLTR